MEHEKQHFVEYLDKPVQEVLQCLQTTGSGLSSENIVARRQHTNTHHMLSKSSFLSIFIRQLKSPFLYIFFTIALISLMLHEWYNGLAIIACLVINMAISFFQEFRAERTLTLLKKYLISTVLVVRDGKEELVASTELVLGDVVRIRPGDILAADIRFMKVQNILMDESVLTGESAPIAKTEDSVISSVKDIYTARNIGFAGTSVLSGTADGVVIAIGDNTAMGGIAHISSMSLRETNFARDINTLGNFIIVVIIVTLSGLLLANIFLKGVGGFFDIFIFSTALAITVIPEALPAVVIFCLARGVAQLARQKVIVKRLAALETLGSVDILCTDKTGTLTENTLEVSALRERDQNTVLLFALLAAERSFEPLDKQNKGFDWALWNALAPDQRKLLDGYTKILAIPFDPIRRKNTVIVTDSHNISYIIVRGSVQDITMISTQSTVQDSDSIWVNNEEKNGRRVLAITTKQIPNFCAHKPIENYEHNLSIVGYISFVDPLKSTVIDAIHTAKKLGLTIKILSGDTPEVCGAIAAQIGLIADPTDVVSGSDFAQKNEVEQRALAEKYSVFARFLPEQKYTMLEYLQESHQVAYMGDGINDAPALKIADVSIAVQDAVDIAREASDIILLKKSLYVLVNGIKEGRIIFTNTLKYIKASLASTVGNFFSLALATLFLEYLPMLPLQILLVNLIADLPYIAISTDHVDWTDINRPKKFLLKDIVIFVLFFGFASSIFDFIFFAYFKNYSPNVLQTGWFVFNSISEIFFIFSMRTKHVMLNGSRPSLLLIFLSLAMMALSISVPFTTIGQNFFQFVPLSLEQIVLLFQLSIAFLVSIEVLKLVYYRYLRI